MTEGAAIDAAWADYFSTMDAMRPLSELANEGMVYFVSADYCQYWAYWSDWNDEWRFDEEAHEGGFDETQAIGWLPT